jgi:hypothetical protein
MILRAVPPLPGSRMLPIAGKRPAPRAAAASVPRPDVACPAWGKLQPAVPAIDPRSSRPRADELIAAMETALAKPKRSPRSQRRPRRWIARAPLTLVLALLCHGSMAQLQPIPEVDNRRSQGLLYELELGGYFSDNRALTRPSDDAGVILLPGLEFIAYRLGGRVEAQARGRIEHYQWLEDPSTSQLRVRAILGADAAIIPNLLHWTVTNNADMRPDGFFVPGTSGGLQQVNVFSTGPSLRLRPHGIWSGLVEAQFANTYADDAEDFNSNRASASAWLRYAPHPRRQLALGAEASQVDFRRSGVLNPDFDRTDVMARYRSDFRWLGFELMGGHTTIRFDDDTELSGPTARATVRVDVREHHQVRLSAAREYSDTARDMLADAARFDRGRTAPGRPPLRPSQYFAESAEATWTGRFDRSVVGLTGYVRDMDYPFEIESDPLSHRAQGVAASITHAINSRQSVRLDGLVERRRFKADNRTDHDRYVSLSFDQRLNTNWSLRAGVSRFDPDADEFGARWVEHQVTVALVRHGGL